MVVLRASARPSRAIGYSAELTYASFCFTRDSGFTLCEIFCRLGLDTLFVLLLSTTTTREVKCSPSMAELWEPHNQPIRFVEFSTFAAFVYVCGVGGPGWNLFLYFLPRKLPTLSAFSNTFNCLTCFSSPLCSYFSQSLIFFPINHTTEIQKLRFLYHRLPRFSRYKNFHFSSTQSHNPQGFRRSSSTLSSPSNERPTESEGFFATKHRNCSTTVPLESLGVL